MVKRVMRKRRGNKSRRGRKRGHGKFYKSKVGKGEVMVNRTPARLHTVIAPHYLTKVDFGFTGQVSLTTPSEGYFSVFGNNVMYPGNCDTTGTGINLFTSATAGGTVFPATLALNHLNSIGMAQLGVLYEKYICLASKISVTFSPDNSSDANNALLVVYPSVDVSGTIANDTQRAMMQPYAKEKQTSTNNNVKQNTISIYMDSPTVLGLTKQQYYDNPSVQYSTQVSGGSTPSGSSYYWYWNINYSPYATGMSLQGAVDVKVTYWLDLFEPLPPTDI